MLPAPHSSSLRTPDAQPAPRLTLLETLAPVLDTALDAVVVIDDDGLVVDWNAGAEATFGWPRQEVIGTDLTSLIVPEAQRAAHTRGMVHYLATGEGPVLRKRIEVTAVRRDGRELPVELIVTPVVDGERRLFLGFLRDVSPRRRTEAALKQQARVSAAMFEIAALAGATDSFEAAIAAALRAVCELTGWPAGHAFLLKEGEQTLSPTMIWHPSDPAAFATLKAATLSMTFARGEGLPGRILAEGQPVWLASLRENPAFLRAKMAEGVEAAFGFPIKSGDDVIAVLEFFSDTPAEPDPELLMAMGVVGEQIGRVFERRLLEDKLRAEKAALEAEVAERIRFEQRQALLLGELNHRVKNTLTVVMGIASQTARSSESMRAFTDDLLSRLASLGRTHSLLTDREWGDTLLSDLTRDVIAPHVRSGDARMQVDGPPVWLNHKAALSMSMVLHELTTNAVKHGALSVPEGGVAVSWRVDPGDGVVLRWREHGVQVAAPPSRVGFGSKMIKACVTHELRGTAQAHWRPDGLEYEVRFPLREGVEVRC